MSYPKCPHCPRDFHGLAITERLEEMRAEYRSRVLYPDGIGEEDYATSAILGDYRHDTDTSRVLCPGSTFIGPRALTPAEAKRDGAFQLPPDSWLSDDPELETPQQRALPRPSSTPPMWAHQPNQRRRRNRM